MPRNLFSAKIVILVGLVYFLNVFFDKTVIFLFIINKKRKEKVGLAVKQTDFILFFSKTM